MENRAFALATGLFILVLVAAAVFTGNWLARDPLERLPYRVISGVPVSGLNPQAQVRFRGIGVGRVRSIELDPRNSQRIQIDIEVAKGIPVTHGTYAQLGQEGITGIAYVHLLDDGKDSAPPAKAPDGVPEIPLRASFFDEIFDQAQDVTRDAHVLLSNLNTLLTEENKQNIAASLASLKRITTDLETTSKRLPETLARVDRGMGGFLGEENQRNTRESLAQINNTVKELPALARDARRLVEDAGKLVERVDRLAGEAQGATGSVRQDTLPRVNALAESVERGAERVGRLAYELERRPDSVLWGRPAPRPGPGEKGFE